ncbi:Zinc finger homeobox protein 4 [Manis javanica]|nr:Zinc finger homeobox protein 4 [Manis javanica]
MSRLVALKSVPEGYSPRQSRVADAPARPTGPRAIPALRRGLGRCAAAGVAGQAWGTCCCWATPNCVARIISIELDRGAGFMNFAPRVMITSADLAATGPVQLASRITYRLAVAGAGDGLESAAQRHRIWAEQQAKAPGVHGVRVESLDSGRPEMRQTLTAPRNSRVGRPAGGAAVGRGRGLGCARLCQQPPRRLGQCCACSARASGALQGLYGGVRAGRPGLQRRWRAGRARAIHHVWRACRRCASCAATWALKPASVVVLAVGVAGFAALLLAASRDIKLGLIAVGGFAVAVLLFAALGWLAVQVLRRLVHESTAPRWLVLATRQIAARPAYAVVQISSLAVGLLALMLLVLLRTDRQLAPGHAGHRSTASSSTCSPSRPTASRGAGQGWRHLL